MSALKFIWLWRIHASVCLDAFLYRCQCLASKVCVCFCSCETVTFPIPPGTSDPAEQQASRNPGSRTTKQHIQTSISHSRWWGLLCEYKYLIVLRRMDFSVSALSQGKLLTAEYKHQIRNELPYRESGTEAGSRLSGWTPSPSDSAGSGAMLEPNLLIGCKAWRRKVYHDLFFLVLQLPLDNHHHFSLYFFYLPLRSFFIFTSSSIVLEPADYPSISSLLPLLWAIFTSCAPMMCLSSLSLCFWHLNIVHPTFLLATSAHLSNIFLSLLLCLYASAIALPFFPPNTH